MAVDLDGTLLDPQNRITPRTAAAITAAVARGVRVAIVTGRMYISAAPYARQLNLLDTPLAAYNGALVKRFPAGELIAGHPVPEAIARSVLALCERQGYYVQAYWDDTCCVEKITDRTRQYDANAGIASRAVGPLLQFMPGPPNKLLIFEPAERIPGIEAELQALLGNSVNTAASFPYFLEITHPDANKGRALADIAASYGLGPEQVLALGDAANDISMLRWAGYSGAMPQAADSVKALATHVATAPPGDGVGELIEKLVLG